MQILFVIFIIHFSFSLPIEGTLLKCEGDSLSGNWPSSLGGGVGYFPSSRQNYGSWVEPSTNKMYIFGGYGYDDDSNFVGIECQLHDVWSYNYDTGVYTWEAGSKTRSASQQTWGIHPMDTATPYPGGREGFGFCDGPGNTAIVFGGYGVFVQTKTGTARLNDVWQYTFGGSWSILNAPDSLATARNDGGDLDANANHSFSIASRPQSRVFSTLATYDGDRVFMFGGKLGSDLEVSNELWEFRTDVNQWRWAQGEIGYTSSGYYVNKGSESSLAQPAARSKAQLWVTSDGTYNTLYLFSGESIAMNSYFSDLWRIQIEILDAPATDYAPSWAWIGGSQAIQKQPTYDERGLYGVDFYPSSRSGAFTFQLDERLFLFGGQGVDHEGLNGYLSDVWAFNPTLESVDPADDSVGSWIFVGGSTESNFDGDPASLQPPGAVSGAAGLLANGKVLMWGGLTSLDGSSCNVAGNEWGLLEYMYEWSFVDQCYGKETYDSCSLNRGWCSSEDNCTCLIQFYGDQCQDEKPYCDHMLASNSLVCNSGKGECVGQNNCTCTSKNYYGQFCDVYLIDSAEYFANDDGGSISDDYIRMVYNIPKERTEGLGDTPESYFDCNSTLIVSGNDLLPSNVTCLLTYGKNSNMSQYLFIYFLLEDGESVSINDGDKMELLAWTTIYNEKVTYTIAYNPETTFDPETTIVVMTSVLAIVIPTLATFCLFICCGCLLVCCVCIGWCTHLQKKKKDLKPFEELGKDLDSLLVDQEYLMDHNFKKLKINKGLFNIKFDDLQIDRVIAAGGSTAVVYQCGYKGKTVALKLFKTKDINSQEAYNSFEKEVLILQKIQNPNVLEFFGCTLDEPRIGVVTEYCDNGDLRRYIQNEEEKYPILLHKDKFRILKEIADVMVILNEEEIIHRDLKSDNILLTSDLVSKLIDFGLSRTVESGSQNVYMTKQAGTSQYMAPEVTLSSHYGGKCDVFSYGIMLFEIITEDFQPYGRFPEFNIELKVALNPEFRPNYKDKDVYKQESLKWYFDLSRRCWDVDVDERPTFSEISEIFRTHSDGTCIALIPYEEELMKQLEERKRMKQMLKLKENDTDKKDL